MSRNSFATMPQPNGSRRCLAASRAAMAKIAKNSQCNQGSEEGITMPRGGSKPGERRGGRQPGSLNLRTVERQEAIAAWAAELNEIIPDAFQGDAHALLMAIYKNPRASGCAPGCGRQGFGLREAAPGEHGGDAALAR